MMAVQPIDGPDARSMHAPWQALSGRVRGELAFDAPMARHVSWRAGGPAACLFVPADVDDLCAALAILPPECPVRCIGLGSNLLVRDGGFAGVLVLTHRVLGGLRALGEGRFEVGAGIPCARLARTATRAGHAPAAFLAGIPGTIGGALAQNAGAFGGETWEWVRAVSMVDTNGVRHRFTPDAFSVGYREVTPRCRASMCPPSSISARRKRPVPNARSVTFWCGGLRPNRPGAQAVARCSAIPTAILRAG